METDKEIYKKALEEGRVPPLPTPGAIQQEIASMAKVIENASKRQIQASERSERSEEQKQKDKQYLDTVMRTKKQGTLRTQRAERAQQMDTKEAKWKVWRIIEARMREKGETYIFPSNSNLKEVLNNLVKYFVWDETCKYDLRKGIWLTGTYGTGKTFLMDCLSQFTLDFDLPTAFVLKSTSQIATEVRENGSDILQLYKQGNLSFDDVGEEQIIRPKYGKDINCMQEILFNLYHRYEKSGKTACVTSNIFPCTKDILRQLGLEECPVATKYGGRVKDRCLKMFNRVLIKGGSFRG